MSIDMLDASRGLVHAHPPFNRQPNHEFSQHVKVNGGEQLWLCHRSDWRNGLIFQSKQIFHVIWPDSNATAFEFPSTKYSNFQFVFCPFRSVQWIIRAESCVRRNNRLSSIIEAKSFELFHEYNQMNVNANANVHRCTLWIEPRNVPITIETDKCLIYGRHLLFLHWFVCNGLTGSCAPTTTTTIIKWYII